MTDAELIAEMRAAHNHADLRLYETYADTHPTHGILTDERELPDELARLLTLAESAATVRAEALREAAEIARGFATCGCDGAHGRCNTDDPPKVIATAILARIQEKNDA